MRCDGCCTEIRGAFAHSRFALLSSEDLEFLEAYLLAGFSIKALAEQSGMGYVAIRSRLDRIIRTYRTLHGNEQAKQAILEQLERGELSPAEAAESLEKIRS